MEMSFRKIKEKVASLAGNEKLGETEQVLPTVQQEDELETVEYKDVKRPKQMSAKSRIRKVEDGIELFERDSNLSDELKPIYSIFKIPERQQVTSQIMPEDVQRVQFSLTEPTGLSVSEVEEFIAEVELGFKHYLNALEQREEHILILVKEIARVNKEMQSLQHSKDMDELLNEDDVIQELRDKVSDLVIENSELNRKYNLLAKRASSSSNAALEQEVEKLRALNRQLTERNAELNEILQNTPEESDIRYEEPKAPVNKTELPPISNISKVMPKKKDKKKVKKDDDFNKFLEEM